MSNTITVDKDTSTDDLIVALQLLLRRIADRIGTGATVGILFGSAVLMTVEEGEIRDR